MRQHESGADDTGGTTFYKESDSATEMDLISKSFKRTHTPSGRGDSRDGDA